MAGDTIPSTVSCCTIPRGRVVPLLAICCFINVEENFSFLVGCKSFIVGDNGKLAMIINALQTIIALVGNEDVPI